MSTKKKRKKKSSIVLSLTFCFLILGSRFHNARAEALPDFVSGSTTIADCVMSYMASAGTFISNQQWIGTLYNDLGESFGTVSDFVQSNWLQVDNAGNIVSTQALEDAISQTNAYTSLNLDTLFGVSQAEAQIGGGVAATGAGTLAGALGGVATSGVLPLAVGVTGAYWGGIALGTLIAHATGLYGEEVSKGVDVNTIQDALDSVPAGGRGVAYIGGTGDAMFLGLPSGVIFCEFPSGQNVRIAIVNMNNTMVTCNQTNLNKGTITTFNVNGVSPSSTFYYYNGYNRGNRAGQRYFATQSDFLAFIEQIRSGTVTKDDFPIYSPDVITPDGNARANIGQNGQITIPSMVPEVNPTGQSIVPGGTSLQDWLRWANGANQNTTNGNPDDNADILEEILEAIRRGVPTVPNPDPDPDPNPNPTPTPTPVPDPDYDPDNPDQPEYDPKETEGPDDVTNGDPWTTPDLLERFPFCLPRDVFRCFEKLSVNERMAPSISWHYVTPLGIHFDFDLNLNDYEGVATILRTLELIAFIIGLALATRNLIGR